VSRTLPDCCSARRSPVTWASLPSVALVLLLPKCPACLAAYGSLFASTAVADFVTGPLAPLLALISIACFVWLALGRRRLVFGLAGMAAVGLVFGIGRELGVRWAGWLGVALLVCAEVYEVRRGWAARAAEARSPAPTAGRLQRRGAAAGPR